MKPEENIRVSIAVNVLRLILLLRKSAGASVSALLDRRVPGRLKLAAIAATLFILSPLNILGDIPLLGIVDDAGLMSLVLLWFARASAPFLNTIDI